jgi:squalene-hopene/tetraprenyl-beta-curcumene cyclase
MASCADLDGSIHVGDLPNYNTSICLLAFKTADDPQYEQLILAAEEFLLGVQLDEGEGFSPDSLYYGGIGYDGSDNRPDLSNMNWVMESLKHNREREIEKSVADPNKETKKLFYEKALVFLSRCQNLEAYNPEGYAVNDGGFIYEAGKSKAGGTKSYGSMTYIGLKSMIYADLSKEDPRVQAAYNWIRENYRIEATPFMGNQGLFYYYQVMAKSLHAYGDDILVDKEGIRHNWRQELAGQLIKIQNEEGWWQNENGRWRENNKILVTIYCILSLEEILKS